MILTKITHVVVRVRRGWRWVWC